MVSVGVVVVGCVACFVVLESLSLPADRLSVLLGIVLVELEGVIDFVVGTVGDVPMVLNGGRVVNFVVGLCVGLRVVTRLPISLHRFVANP